MPYLTSEVRSKDGATISCREFGCGHGPGVVMLHGGLESADSHQELAETLARDFTVYLPDRRGRGQSGPYGEDYGMRKEVEDVAALLAKTGARRLFGVRLGALISLQSALTLPTIQKAVIYEPPPTKFSPGATAAPTEDADETEIAANNVAPALAIVAAGGRAEQRAIQRCRDGSSWACSGS